MGTVGYFAGFIFGLLAAPELTAEGPFEVELIAPQGCPSGAQLAARVRTLLGSGRTDSRAHMEAAPTRFRVMIERAAPKGSQYQANVKRMKGRHHTQQLRYLEHPSSCAVLLEGVAFVISVSLRRGLGAATAPDRQRPRRVHWQHQIAVDAGFDAGTLPRPNAGLRLGYRVRASGAVFGVVGSLWLPQELPFSGEPEAILRYVNWSAAAMAGYEFRLGRHWRLPLTLIGQFGQIYVRAQESSRSVGSNKNRLRARDPVYAPWAAVGLGFGTALIVHPRLRIQLALEPFVAVYRANFQVHNWGHIHRPAAFGVRAFLGFAVQFQVWNRQAAATK